MIEWAGIQRFDWDEGNSRKSVDRHGVSQVEAEQVFVNEPLLVLEDERHGGQEVRFHALVHTDAGRLLHVIITLRLNDTMIRVISARPMHRKERLRYEEET
jgi:uncharacterized DUF497 family protein